MKRYTTPHGKDRRVFNSTAERTSAINVRPKIMRGGFRL